jgi:hypothetical protein
MSIIWAAAGGAGAPVLSPSPPAATNAYGTTPVTRRRVYGGGRAGHDAHEAVPAAAVDERAARRGDRLA